MEENPLPTGPRPDARRKGYRESCSFTTLRAVVKGAGLRPHGQGSARLARLFRRAFPGLQNTKRWFRSGGGPIAEGKPARLAGSRPRLCVTGCNCPWSLKRIQKGGLWARFRSLRPHLIVAALRAVAERASSRLVQVPFKYREWGIFLIPIMGCTPFRISFRMKGDVVGASGVFRALNVGRRGLRRLKMKSDACHFRDRCSRRSRDWVWVKRHCNSAEVTSSPWKKQGYRLGGALQQ